MKCPKCGSEMVREVKEKNLLNVILRTIGYKSFKCQICGGRFRSF